MRIGNGPLIRLVVDSEIPLTEEERELILEQQEKFIWSLAFAKRKNGSQPFAKGVAIELEAQPAKKRAPNSLEARNEIRARTRKAMIELRNRKKLPTKTEFARHCGLSRNGKELNAEYTFFRRMWYVMLVEQGPSSANLELSDEVLNELIENANLQHLEKNRKNRAPNRKRSIEPSEERARIATSKK